MRHVLTDEHAAQVINKNYSEVPWWWYIILLALSFFAGTPTVYREML